MQKFGTRLLLPARGQLHGRPERLHPDRPPGLHDADRPGPARPADPLQRVAVDLEPGALHGDRRGRRQPARHVRGAVRAHARSSSRRSIIPCAQPWLGAGGTFAQLYWTHIYNSTGHPMFSDDRTQVMFDGPEGLSAFQTIEAGLKSGLWDAALPEHHQRARGVRRVRQGQHGDGHAQRVGDRADREGADGRRQVEHPPVPGHRVREDGLGPGRRRHRRQQVDQAARGIVELLQPAVHARHRAGDQPARAGALPADPQLGPRQPRGHRGPVRSSRPTRRRPRASPTCGRRRTTTRPSSTTWSTR